MAGVVAVGAGVTRFQPEDEVHGTCESGSLAEYVTAPQQQLALKRADLRFEQAGVVSGMTALQAIHGRGPGGTSTPGDGHQRSDGVGSFCRVQIARHSARR